MGFAWSLRTTIATSATRSWCSSSSSARQALSRFANERIGNPRPDAGRSSDRERRCDLAASLCARQQSYVNVSQGQALGRGFYVPVCDGRQHTFTVGVAASQGQFQPGTADGLTFAFVEAGGQSFSGVDENTQLRLVTS
jgi:hypothetical protein